MDTIFTLLVNAGNGPVIRDGVDRATTTGLAHVSLPGAAQSGPARAARAPLTSEARGQRPLREHHASSSTTSRAERCTSGRRPTSARTSCSASTTAPPGASSCGGCSRRRLGPALSRSRARRLDHGRLHLSRPEGARGAAELARQLRAGVPARDGRARGACWATSARAAPSTGRSRSARRTSTSPLAALSPDAERLEAVVERARRAHEELAGVEVIWRQDCYQLPTGRTSFGFKDGIGQPAVEGSGRPRLEPEGASRSRPARSSSATRTRRAAAADADPGGARPQRHLRRLPQAAHAGGGLPAVPPREGREPRGGGAARREDGRALAERRAARALPGAGRPRRSAPTRSATTTSSTATIRAASSARPARTRGARTRATRSTATAASTCACTA